MAQVLRRLSLLGLIYVAPAFAATLQVAPKAALYDAPVHIVVSGLKPDAVVTLKLRTTDARGHQWHSQATFHANLGGELNLAHAAPLKGSYRGVEPMGLFWSMRPSKARKFEYAMPTTGSSKKRLSAGTSYTLTAIVHGNVIGKDTLVRRAIAPDVTVRRIRRRGFYADLYYPRRYASGKEKYPALIALGGAKGGIRAADQFGAWLSSHGFVVLSLAWYRFGTLPKNMVHVPVNTINKGLDYLASQPFVDPSRIGLIGGSWGGILSLFAASHLGRIHAVVSWMGGPVVGPGLERGVPPAGYKPVDKSPFLYHGKPVGFTSYAALMKFMKTGHWALIEPGFIPVWKINGPILFVTGGDDKLEYSAIQATWAMHQLKAHHKAQGDRILFYRNAGHLIWPGYTPTTRDADFSKYIPVGGTARGYAKADAAVGPAVLKFLRSSLAHG